MEETTDVSKVDDEGTVMRSSLSYGVIQDNMTGEIQEGDISDPPEEHEYMFIEKEEPEFDETEDLGSLVNEVLLQSAELIEGASSISDEQEMLEETPLLNPEQEVFPSAMDEHMLSLPTEGNAMSASNAVATSVSSTVTPEVTKTRVNTSSIQTQPRVSQTTTTTSQTNNIGTGHLSFPDFIQNAINVQNMEANMLRNIGLSLIEASNRGFSQTVSHASQPVNNIKNINFLRMGVRPGISMRPLQTLPRTLQMAQIRAQMTRFGIPRHNLRMPSSNFLTQNIHQSARVPRMANVPPLASVPRLVNVPPTTSVPHLVNVPPTTSVPHLAHIPPVSNVRQTTMQTAQLNLMKNLGIPLQRPRLPTPIRNVSQLNAFQNASDLVRAFQMQSKSASQVGMQCFVPVSSASQNVKQATIIGNSQTQIQGSGVSRSLGSSHISPSVRNGSQFSVPRFCPPQLVANALQTRVPLRPGIFLRPPMSSQQVITPQPRIPQMNVGLQQNIASNVQRLSVPNVVNNGPRVGVTPLSNNVQRLNVPQVAASVPRINATQISGTRGVLPVNTSLVSRSMNQTLIPPNMTQVGLPHFKVPGMPLPSLSTNIPRIPVPQTRINIPQLGLPTRVTNLGLQPQTRTTSAKPAEPSQDHIVARATQLSRSVSIPGTPSTSATTLVAHATTSQTSSTVVSKTPVRHWEPVLRNLDKSLLQSEQPKDPPNVSEHAAKSTPSEVAGVQQHQQTAGTSSQQSSGEPHDKNSKLKTSCSTIHQKPKPKAKSASMKTRLKNQLILLKLWKTFEKHNLRYLKSANKKKLFQARKQRRLLLEKEKNELTHKTSAE